MTKVESMDGDLETTRTAWIINHYAPFPSKDGWAGLHLEIANHLKGSPWSVRIVAASTSHPSGEQQLDNSEWARQVDWKDTRSLWLRACSYKGNGVRRIVNMAEFGLRLLSSRAVAQLPKPKVVVGRVVNPVAAWASAYLATRTGAAFVLEISDIWPATLIQLGKLSARGLLARVLDRLEKSLISRSDAVMSPMPYVNKYLSENGFEEKDFYWVPNGIDASQGAGLPASGSTTVGHGFKFMYIGSLGNANAVDTIIDAFDSFCSNSGHKDALLEIVGSGPLLNDLQMRASLTAHPQQIVFTDRIERHRVIQHASTADALVANMRDLPLYKYGVALNKMFDYMLSGRPIIFASNSANNIVRDADAGIVIKADDVVELSSAMERMTQTSAVVRRAWGEAGRTHVLDHYTYGASADRFLAMLNDLEARQGGRDA